MNAPVDLGFSDRRVPIGAHICYLYVEADDDRLENVRRFFEAGARAGDRMLYITDVREPSAVRARLGPVGGAVEVRCTSEECTPDGRFSPDLTLTRLREFATAGREQGQAYARVVGEMAWAAKGFPGSERLIEYEARLTDVIQATGMTGICQYDARLFDGPTLLDLFAVHPWIVTRGQLVENPFFVPPRVFLERLRPPVPVG